MAQSLPDALTLDPEDRRACKRDVEWIWRTYGETEDDCPRHLREIRRKYLRKAYAAIVECSRLGAM